MQTAQLGNTVKVHYSGKLAGDFVFDSSVGSEPLEFLLGAGQVIVGFETGIIGMSIGDKKTIEIPAKEAYGDVIQENIIVVPREEIPDDMEIEIGTTLNLHQDGTAEVVPVTVSDFNETTLTLDANHPLAGKDLIFDLELVEIL